MIYLFTWVGGRVHVMQRIVIGKRLMVCAADCCDCGGDHGCRSDGQVIRWSGAESRVASVLLFYFVFVQSRELAIFYSRLKKVCTAVLATLWSVLLLIERR